MNFKEYYITEDKVQFLNKTTLPMYDDMIANPGYFKNKKNTLSKVVHVTGTEYIRYVAKQFGISREKLIKQKSMKDVEKYKQSMLKGDKFPILVADIRDPDNFRQEGIHRALASEMIDPKMKIPILIVKNYK